MSFYRAYRYETPKNRIYGLMTRLSRNRVIHEEEAERIITKAAEKWSGNPTQTCKAFLNVRYRFSRWVKGKACWDFGLHNHGKWEQEARKDKVQFINIEDYYRKKRISKITKIYQQEREAIENRRLINQIKEQIKNGKEHSNHRATARVSL